jgi:predicted RNA-binding protein with EMAP domain
MANVYEGKPDERQTDFDDPLVTSRFRPRYRALSKDELAHHDQIKAACEKLEELIEELPDGRYKSLALTTLEESCMWAIKQLTA